MPQASTTLAGNIAHCKVTSAFAIPTRASIPRRQQPEPADGTTANDGTCLAGTAGGLPELRRGLPGRRGLLSTLRAPEEGVLEGVGVGLSVLFLLIQFFKQLPKLTWVDKAEITGLSKDAPAADECPTPGRTAADAGAPLNYQESKTQECGKARCRTTCSRRSLTFRTLWPGSGALASACLTLGIGYTGFCVNERHRKHTASTEPQVAVRGDPMPPPPRRLHAALPEAQKAPGWRSPESASALAAAPPPPPPLRDARPQRHSGPGMLSMTSELRSEPRAIAGPSLRVPSIERREPSTEPPTFLASPYATPRSARGTRNSAVAAAEAARSAAKEARAAQRETQRATPTRWAQRSHTPAQERWLTAHGSLGKEVPGTGGNGSKPPFGRQKQITARPADAIIAGEVCLGVHDEQRVAEPHEECCSKCLDNYAEEIPGGSQELGEEGRRQGRDD
eukprot:s2830_g1.t1